MSQTPNDSLPAAAAAAPRRRKALAVVAAVVLLGGGAWGTWYALVGSHYEHTDNAYVQANVIQITPQVAGTVLAIGADDTDLVKAGQVEEARRIFQKGIEVTSRLGDRHAKSELEAALEQL